MNKTYYNHIDLVKDIKEAKSDTIFNCDFDIYFLVEYFHNQDRKFNWYKEKLRYVIYQENNIKIVTGDRFLSVHIEKNNIEYFVDKNLFIDQINVRKNNHIKKLFDNLIIVNDKYEEIYNNISKWD